MYVFFLFKLMRDRLINGLIKRPAHVSRLGQMDGRTSERLLFVGIGFSDKFLHPHARINHRTRPHSSFPLHVAYGLFMFTIAVFNGANYYIEVGPYLLPTHKPDK